MFHIPRKTTSIYFAIQVPVVQGGQLQLCRAASTLRFATLSCTAVSMKQLRWPGLAIQSMVRIVVSGRTMLMRLIMLMTLLSIGRVEFRAYAELEVYGLAAFAQSYSATV